MEPAVRTPATTTGRSGPPRAVVLDCDGTLVDTAATWERAEHRVVAAHGGTWTTETRREVHGLGIAAAAEVMAGHTRDGADGADGATVLDELLAAYAGLVATDGLAPMPGAAELLADLHGRVPTAVASNTPDPPLRAVLAAAGLLDHVDVVVGPSRDMRSKPAPDVYLAACAALGESPSDCHAVEDSASGITAALAAGMTVTGVSRDAVLAGCAQVATLHELRGRLLVARP